MHKNVVDWLKFMHKNVINEKKYKWLLEWKNNPRHK